MNKYPKYFKNNIDGSVAEFNNLSEYILIKGSRKSAHIPHFPKGTCFTDENHSNRNIWTPISFEKLKKIKFKEDIKLIKDIIYYFKFNDLPDSIIIKALFLLDWKFCIENNKPLFGDIIWLKENGLFNIKGKKKYKIHHLLKSNKIRDELPNNIISTVDFIIEKYNRLKRSGFEQLYCSVYPYIKIYNNETLDVFKLNKEYKEIKHNIKLCEIMRGTNGKNKLI